ncbi:MAG: DUF2975 domain-containing protein [Limisphaerales bacterium]
MKNIQNKTRIIKVSKVLRTILRIGLILQTIGFVGLTSMILTASATGLKSPVVFENFVALAGLPFAFLVTLNFFRLFDRLKAGHLFNSQTVKLLETAGKWWIVLGIVQIICGALKAWLFSPDVTIASGNAIVGGLAVYFIAWLFREAQELQEEQELTV